MSVVGDPSNQLFDNYKKFYESKRLTDYSLAEVKVLHLDQLLRLFLQTTLIGGDRQGLLAAVLGVGAALNILLNLWAIPRWGWQGAVGATYVAEIVMSGILTLFLLRATWFALHTSS